MRKGFLEVAGFGLGRIDVQRETIHLIRNYRELYIIVRHRNCGVVSAIQCDETVSHTISPAFNPNATMAENAMIAKASGLARVLGCSLRCASFAKIGEGQAEYRPGHGQDRGGDHAKGKVGLIQLDRCNRSAKKARQYTDQKPSQPAHGGQWEPQANQAQATVFLGPQFDPVSPGKHRE